MMRLWGVLAILLWPAFGWADGPALSFRGDVQPVLTKAGCNAGACHGSFQGRGGMQLSLLGYDSPADYETMFLTGRGRRVNTVSPEESLLLRKASGRMPHGGGLRLRPDTPGYQILRDYIAQGLARPTTSDAIVQNLLVTPDKLTLAPGGTAGLKVVARWSDGVERDVTAWSLFDSQNRQMVEIDAAGSVTAQKPGVSAVTARFAGQVAAVPVTIPYGPSQPIENVVALNEIDRFALASWQQLGVVPAAAAGDADFSAASISM